MTPKGIYELMGIALGCLRLSYDDFCRMDFEEFAAVYEAYGEQRDADFKDRWERMRILAFINIQPHINHKKAGRLTPEKLFPLPWDRQKRRTEQDDAPKLTPAQQRKRMEELAKRLGDELI